MLADGFDSKGLNPSDRETNRRDAVAGSETDEPSAPLPSVHELEPLETGGTSASIGFDYQDHVALGFCVDMLHDGRLLAVWCELLDDVTIIWDHGGAECAEFIQVKGTRPESLWSVSSLTGRASGKVGASLLEKSLAHDRCREDTKFRMVTLENVASELRLLEAPRDAVERQPGTQAFKELLSRLDDRLEAIRSPRGRGTAYWLSHVEWHVRGTSEAIRDRTQLRLNEHLWSMYEIGAPDHQAAVYDFLLGLTQKARVAAYTRLSSETKKLRRRAILSAVGGRVAALRHPTPTTGGSLLRQSLRHIGVGEIEADSIVQQHLEYRDEERRSAFISSSDYSPVYDELQRRLRDLRLARLAGELVLSPLQFYRRCLAEVREFHEFLPVETRPDIRHVEGMMYEMVNRAIHYFGDAPVGAAA